MNDEIPVSLIIEDGQSDEIGIEELCRHSKRILWLSVRDGRRVVYKGLTEDLRSHPEEIASLRKEYSLGLRIECEGVVRYYSFELHPQLGPIIIMEYVDGTTLQEYLGNGQSDGAYFPPLNERLKISIDIAESLAVIHGSGVLHRDLKPDNILIRKRDLRPKIIDFGHADAEDFVIYKNSVGTSQYGSPEQQVPSGGSMAGDIYSFGKILEKLLPERRYKAIINACISNDESKRPDIKWISKHLSNTWRGSLRWMGITGVVLVGLLAISFLIYFSDGKQDAENDVATEVAKADSIIKVRTIETDSVEVDTDEVSPKPESQSVVKERDLADKLPSENDEIMEAVTNKNIPENISAIIDKYSRKADIINERYGTLSYFDNIEENGELRIKRGKEHFALSDSMEKELSELGVDKLKQHDAYHRLWTYILFETNRIDGVDEAREEIMKNY
ncbi:MAG: protein kinase [Muribaculaceae bacterium]|nr:protein kinase [Muribaculaceae bacterium]